jgi:ribosomal-protein-alanine N-acetyltransferase
MRFAPMAVVLGLLLAAKSSAALASPGRFATKGAGDITLSTPRLRLEAAHPNLAPAYGAYLRRNWSRLRPHNPTRPPSWFLLPNIRARLRDARAAAETGAGLHLFLFRQNDHDHPIVGDIQFSRVDRSGTNWAFLGYQLDGSLEGAGYMSEALRAAIGYAFGPFELELIRANYRPTNARSGTLLQHLGFQRVGYTPRYLEIDGAFRGHIHTELHRDAWQ